MQQRRKVFTSQPSLIHLLLLCIPPPPPPHPPTPRRQGDIPRQQKDAAVLSVQKGCLVFKWWNMLHVAASQVYLIKSIAHLQNERSWGRTESTVLGWRLLTFDSRRHIWKSEPNNLRPPFPGVSSAISSFHNLNAFIISSPMLCPTFSGCRTFLHFSILEMSKPSQNYSPTRHSRLIQNIFPPSYFNKQYIITRHLWAQRQWHLWQRVRLNRRGW